MNAKYRNVLFAVLLTTNDLDVFSRAYRELTNKRGKENPIYFKKLLNDEKYDNDIRRKYWKGYIARKRGNK